MDQTPWGQASHTGGQPVPPQQGTGSMPLVTGGIPPLPPDYPFEEPEQAPELRQERSDNLYSRTQPFWHSVDGSTQPVKTYPQDPNYWNHPEVLQDDQVMLVDDSHPGDRIKKYLGSGVLKKILVILAVLAVVCVVLYSTLFQVREINVLGNTSIPAEEIIRLSGVKMGMNTMSIDDDVVMRRVENNRYLRCTLVDVKWNSVDLYVTERVPAVYINHNGMSVVLDDRGWVLEESLHTDMGHTGLIFVTGLLVDRCDLGQGIVLRSSSQMLAYRRILVELKAMQGLDLLKELDLSRMDRIYLATNDGFDVHLGNSDRIHEKLRSMMLTRLKVIEMGYSGGTLDVTDPAKPTFTPAGL